MTKNYADKDYNQLTPDDMVDIGEVYPSKYYDYEVLKLVLKENPDILHHARMWGWGETQVGDDILSTANKLGLEFEKA